MRNKIPTKFILKQEKTNLDSQVYMKLIPFSLIFECFKLGLVVKIKTIQTNHSHEKTTILPVLNDALYAECCRNRPSTR
jgi:hypothetical protein